jgi:hypothetical protein
MVRPKLVVVRIALDALAGLELRSARDHLQAESRVIVRAAGHWDVT